MANGRGQRCASWGYTRQRHREWRQWGRRQAARGHAVRGGEEGGWTMEDSEPAEDGLLAGLRWNRSARDQAQLKHKIRDLPGLLKHGLHLRKKSVSISNRPLNDCPSFRVWWALLAVLSFNCQVAWLHFVLWGRFVSSSRLRCFSFSHRDRCRRGKLFYIYINVCARNCACYLLYP